MATPAGVTAFTRFTRTAQLRRLLGDDRGRAYRCRDKTGSNQYTKRSQITKKPPHLRRAEHPVFTRRRSDAPAPGRRVTPRASSAAARHRSRRTRDTRCAPPAAACEPATDAEPPG